MSERSSVSYTEAYNVLKNVQCHKNYFITVVLNFIAEFVEIGFFITVPISLILRFEIRLKEQSLKCDKWTFWNFAAI